MTESAAIWEDIDALIPWGDNPRINDHAVENVANSIKRFGFASPIVARLADKMVIAGHTRLKAARSLGLDKVPVRYLDIDPADAKMLALADNKIGEIADWDEGALEKIINELSLSADDLANLGWNNQDLDNLFEPIFDSQKDEVIEVCDDDPISKLGEVYELGEHRLICGDSTLSETWEKLMQGEKADMVFTDPPYGMNLDTDYSKMGSTRNKYKKIIGDQEDFDASLIFLNVKSPVYYLWGADYYSDTIVNYKKGSYLVWSKAQTEEENSVFGSRFELCWRFPKRKKEVWFVRGINQSSERLGEHPTQKPTVLGVRAIKLETKEGDIVVDGYGGSGSTLIAAAQTGRRARLVELDPKYCDVIRKRWFKYATQNNLDVGDGLDG